VASAGIAVIDPSQEFADIYDPMGALVYAALGDAGPAWLAEMPWSPLEYRTVWPGDVHADRVSAELPDGVLTLTVPKS
jgi:hypothetical protein